MSRADAIWKPRVSLHIYHHLGSTFQQPVHRMSAFNGGRLLSPACFRLQPPVTLGFRSRFCQHRVQFQSRAQHNNYKKRQPSHNSYQPPRSPAEHELLQPQDPSITKAGRYTTIDINPPASESRRVVVYYLRPAIWAVAVSGLTFFTLSYFEAKKELKAKSISHWLQPPQWSSSPPKRGPPTPTDIATTWWAELNPISKLSYSLIATNAAVHATSFVAPRLWDHLWHMPARNVNYTQFTSMFVHSGALHFGVNMYALNTFMLPVGYSRLFEGSPYHTLSFFLATGVLSGFAQHWSTLISVQKRAVPEIFIRCGGASGALFGILGAFCMQYPTAGLGILFVPVHFDAQYVLPAIMLFDFVGMVRGYSFVNFGHAVCHTYLYQDECLLI